MTKERFINDADNASILINIKGELFMINYSDDMNRYEVWKILSKINNVFDQLETENKQLHSELAEKDIQLDYLQAENAHMKTVLEENEQLKQQSNSVYEIVKEYVMSHHCISTMRMLKKIEKVMWND